MTGALTRNVWRRFWALTATERRLLISAATVVVICRLGLWLLPFRRMQRWVDRAALHRTSRPSEPAKIAWAVRAAACYVPRATCMVQALAAHLMLARAGHPSQLHIGVALNEGRKFEAHAWVESEGKILIGGADSKDRYAPLAVWEGKGT